MKRNYIIPLVILIVLLVVFFTRLSKHQKSLHETFSVEQRQSEIIKRNSEPPGEIKTYTTHSGKTITVENTHPVGVSLSTVIIKPVVFEIDIPITLSDIDPLKKVLVADLDQNGFDEIYLITQSAGSGSYGRIYGFASNRDKSLSTISTEEINATDKKSDLYSGYRGHDSYYIEDGHLTREFPVYNENDSNAQPTGGFRKLRYSLIAGEAGYQLNIKH